jgi:hypothetical protein
LAEVFEIIFCGFGLSCNVFEGDSFELHAISSGWLLAKFFRGGAALRRIFASASASATVVDDGGRGNF